MRRRAFNFVEIKPKRQFLKLEFPLPRTPETDAFITDAGLDALPYDQTWQHYRIRVREADLVEQAGPLETLIRLSA